jgi:FkbM family methyltransferase
MNQSPYRLAAMLARAYLQHFPLTAYKRQLWDNVIRRRIAYRDLAFQSRTQSGVSLTLNTADIIQRYIYYFGIWEPAITEYFKRSLKPGDTVIDIGANIGYHSLLASQLVGASGRVFAIEASPSIFAALLQNIDRNDATNITALHAAVYHETAELPIYLHSKENLGASTIIADVANRRDATVEGIVRAMKLQDLVAPEDVIRARLIKIDVEGAEWSVLQGMAAILPRLSAATEILVEVEPESLSEHGTTTKEFISRFGAAGFQPYGINMHMVDSYASRIDAFLAPPVPEVQPLGDLSSATFDRTEFLFRR